MEGIFPIWFPSDLMNIVIGYVLVEDIITMGLNISQSRVNEFRSTLPKLTNNVITTTIQADPEALIYLILLNLIPMELLKSHLRRIESYSAPVRVYLLDYLLPEFCAELYSMELKHHSSVLVDLVNIIADRYPDLLTTFKAHEIVEYQPRIFPEMVCKLIIMPGDIIQLLSRPRMIDTANLLFDRLIVLTNIKRLYRLDRNKVKFQTNELLFTIKDRGFVKFYHKIIANISRLDQIPLDVGVKHRPSHYITSRDRRNYRKSHA